MAWPAAASSPPAREFAGVAGPPGRSGHRAHCALGACTTWLKPGSCQTCYALNWDAGRLALTRTAPVVADVVIVVLVVFACARNCDHNRHLAGPSIPWASQPIGMLLGVSLPWAEGKDGAPDGHAATFP